MAKPIGVCLSGGGARGIAHIGVLQALEENDIFPHHVSGASAGALVGALYAAGYAPKDILTIFKDSSLIRLFKVGIPTTGFTDNGYLVEVLREHIGEDSFEALPRELHISVTNLTTGQYEIKSKGELFRVAAASAAIPILFQGWNIDGEIYVDGGVLNNLPIEPLLGRCYPIIGVNVTPIQPQEDRESIFDVGYRTFDLVMWGNLAPRLKECHIALEPEAHRYALFDIKSADDIFALGYETTLAQMDKIKRLLDVKGQSEYLRPQRRYLSGQEPAPEPEVATEETDTQDNWWQKQGHRMGDFFRQIGQRFGN